MNGRRMGRLLVAEEVVVDVKVDLVHNSYGWEEGLAVGEKIESIYNGTIA